MRVSVEVPDQKQGGLDSALVKQFADIQKQLMSMVKDQSSSKHEMHKMMMDSMESQQAMFLKAMERLIGAISQDDSPSDDLLESLQGIKKTISDLPGDLKDALDKQYQSIQKSMKVTVSAPKVSVSMPSGLMNRIDSLESAMLQGMKRSRNRTFGSNY